MSLKTVSVAPGGGGNGGGTVTSVGTGTGLTGGPITTSGTVSIANTTVTAGTYGDGTHVPQIIVNAQGQITSASNVAISSGGSGTVTSVNVSGGTTGLTTSGGPITGAGTITIAGTLATTNGGTGLTAFTSGGALYATSTSVLTTGTLPIASGGTGQTTASTAFNALSPVTTTGDLIIGNGTNSNTRLGIGGSGTVLTSNGTTASWSNPAYTGTVTSVSFTGGIISVATATTTPAFTIAGTSGGIPYFSSTSTWASSGILAANTIVIGGGAGTAPTTTTTGTGVLTALGVNTGTAGSFVVNGGALGTPSSGTLTNVSGLPISTGISGLGTGVATSLANAINAASGVVTGAGTATSGGIGYGNGTNHAYSTAGTAGQVVLSGGSTTPTYTTGTLSLAGNVTYAGAFTQTFTATANTSVTLPTTGTLSTLAGTETLTNKRVTPRATTDTSNSATPTINTDNTDINVITGQSNAITSFTTNLSGTPTNGQKLWIAITGTTAIAITWGASFEASTTALPTTTVTTARLDVGFVWNVATSKWRCVAVA